MSFFGIFFLLYEIMGGFCLFPKVAVDFLSNASGPSILFLSYALINGIT